MAEYSRLAKGSFVASSASQVVNLPFQPDYVELWNMTNIGAAVAASKVLRAWWDNNASITPSGKSAAHTMVEMYSSGSVVIFDTIADPNGISSYNANLMLQYGPLQGHNQGNITDFSMTAANPIAVTTVGNHLLQTGDVVIFQNLSQSSSTGMQQIAGIPFMVTVTGATGFTIKWNGSGSNYTAFNTATSTGNVGTYKKVLYPFLYFPGVSFISALTLASTTTVVTTAQHQLQVGQEVGFRIPSSWGTQQLNELPNSLIPGSPIYGYVQSVTDLQTFVVNINSSSYTAFNPNQPFASYPGEFFPQVVAVGDVNTGGVQYSGGNLYPSPQYSYASYNDSSTINGPALLGSYVNNTRQGFMIGAGVPQQNAAGAIMASGDKILWHAYLHDFANP